MLVQSHRPVQLELLLLALYLHTVNAYPRMDPSVFLELDGSFTHLWSDRRELNDMQVKAMRKALQYKFSLIQGPPGVCSTNVFNTGTTRCV